MASAVAATSARRRFGRLLEVPALLEDGDPGVVCLLGRRGGGRRAREGGAELLRGVGDQLEGLRDVGDLEDLRLLEDLPRDRKVGKRLVELRVEEGRVPRRVGLVLQRLV